MENVENRIYDPYLDIELRNKLSNKRGALKNFSRVRRVYQRNIFLAILYTILTFGIYGIFWQFEIAKETTAICEDDEGFSPFWVVFFTILTLGIYGVYWGYKVGKKHNNYYLKHFNLETNYSIVYLLLLLLNYCIPVLSLVCYAVMQSKINELLKYCDSNNIDGIYVKDSSLFNRPILSTIVLILIAQNVPSQILSIYENMFAGAPGNPIGVSSSSDLMQSAIQNSAEQIIYADTPFMIFYCLFQIALIIGVLWWFKLRFKHASVEGVLAMRNFGRACLIALPGLLFVLINVLGFNPSNFKIGIVLLGFVPGFVEEITFRGLVIPNFMRVHNNSKGIWLSLFISAGIFGLIHAANILAGADPGTTIFQVFYAFALGILFGAILIRYGNLWPCIILHGFVDAFAMMSDEALEQGAVQTQAFAFSWDIMPILILSLIFIAYGLYLCRPKKHAEICELWADKWGEAVC